MTVELILLYSELFVRNKKASSGTISTKPYKSDLKYDKYGKNIITLRILSITLLIYTLWSLVFYAVKLLRSYGTFGMIKQCLLFKRAITSKTCLLLIKGGVGEFMNRRCTRLVSIILKPKINIYIKLGESSD